MGNGCCKTSVSIQEPCDSDIVKFNKNELNPKESKREEHYLANIDENHSKVSNIDENKSRVPNIDENHSKVSNVDENKSRVPNIDENHSRVPNIDENHSKEPNIDENHRKVPRNKSFNDYSTKTEVEDEFTSSGYSTGTKETGSEIGSVFTNVKQYWELQTGRQSQVWSDTEDSSFVGHDTEAPEQTGLSPKERDQILRHFTYLKSELDPEFLLDYFLQDDVFTDDQAEQIKCMRSRRNIADQFLRMLLMSRKSNAYTVFMKSLNNSHCTHILSVLDDETEHNIPADENFTDKHALSLLKRHRKAIIENLEDPIRIAEYFLVHREFSVDEYELIFNQNTRASRAQQLLDTVSKQNHLKRGYSILCHALNKEGYSLLNTSFENTEETNLKMVEDNSSSYELVSHENACFKSDVEDDDEVCITLNIENVKRRHKHKKERHIVSRANKYKIRVKINDNLISETKCLISDIEMGSIVIRLKSCQSGALKHLFENDTEGGVLKLLEIIFAHPAMSKQIYPTGTKLDVKVELIQDQQTEDRGKRMSRKEIVLANSKFLVEELDAVTFINLDIFTKEEKDRLLTERPVSRAHCTSVMLQILLGKQEQEVSKFLDEIKQSKQFVWNHLFSEESTERFDDAVLTRNYELFVENISPAAIANHCIERGLLNEDILHHESFISSQRDLFARIITQEILLQDERKRSEFLKIIDALNQIPPTLSVSKVAETRSQQIVSTKTRTVFMGTYQRIDVTRKYKVDVGDRESGYVSHREQSPPFYEQFYKHQSNEKDNPSEYIQGSDYRNKTNERLMFGSKPHVEQTETEGETSVVPVIPDGLFWRNKMKNLRSKKQTFIREITHGFNVSEA